MVKTPLFPSYIKTQQLLKVIDSKSESEFKSMRNSIFELVGTPQKPVDWTNPENWIPERLKGKDKEFAKIIWNGTNKKVNPRHIGGIYYLMNNYNLIEVNNGVYKLTDRGEIFISNNNNEIIQEIDNEEGLIYILFLCSINRNASRKVFIEDWSKYLQLNSNYTKPSGFQDTLRRRLSNLTERGYTKRETINYDITELGSKYLIQLKDKIEIPSTSAVTELNTNVENFNNSQKKILREELYKLDPYQFEHVIKELLDSMGYEDVEVTAQSNDKGVDVVGNIQNGITKVKEVIQVKKVLSNVQRPILDALRGTLHRFDAFQGTIITLSDFSKGTKEAAFERGAAPITLINGNKLINLLIENNIGITKKTLEYFVVDKTYFETDKEGIE